MVDDGKAPHPVRCHEFLRESDRVFGVHGVHPRRGSRHDGNVPDTLALRIGRYADVPVRDHSKDIAEPIDDGQGSAIVIPKDLSRASAAVSRPTCMNVSAHEVRDRHLTEGRLPSRVVRFVTGHVGHTSK